MKAEKPKALFWVSDALYDRFFNQDLRDRLERSVDLIFPDTHTEASFRDLLRDADFVFSTWGMPQLQNEWIDAAPKLKAIFYAAGSVKSWLCDRCFDREILVTSAAGANAIPVAQYTVAMVILSLKNILPNIFQLKSNPGMWQGDLDIPIFGVGAHATVGIIAASKIGRLVIPELQRMELRVLVYDPFLSHEESEVMGVEKVELDELMSHSDVVSLHAPNIPETNQMIHRDNLRLMKEGATFINTSRGALVNEADLIEVLKEGKISAVLDVTDPEPPAQNSPLYSLSNCFITPHLAGTCAKECRRMCRQSIEELERFCAGHSPIEAVTRDMLVHMA